MGTKKCIKCKLDKSLDRFNLYRKYNGEFELKARCKDCNNEYLTKKRELEIDYMPIPSIENEKWRVVPFNVKYSVSSVGRVKAHVNKGYRHREVIMKQQKTKRGYLSVMMSKKRYQVHQVVAKAFIENPNNYPQINHLNCIKTDNSINNLEWCNNSINIKHAWDNGLIKRKRKKYANT